MNVQPSIDQEDQMEVLKLPDDVLHKHEELKDAKDAQKARIQQLKARYSGALDKRNKMLDRLEKIKGRLGGERADVVGMRKKLERLRAQNDVMQKL